MTQTQQELLARIEAFAFDEPGTSFTFAQRLARENGWKAEFTRRALREYRRFVFLAMAAGHPVCPSEAVDQVWHQHLTFTQNYWEDLCAQLLGQPLHHGPTRGGAAESEKHHDRYERTLATYRTMFGEEAPADLWPSAAQRFGEGGSFVRVNRREAWIIAKPRWLRQAALLALGTSLPLFMGAVRRAPAEEPSGSIPILDMPGKDFLVLYGIVVVVALFAVIIIKSLGKTSPRPYRAGDEPTDPYLVATLTGGPNLAVYAALTELARRNLITVAGPEAISQVPGATPPGDLHPLEQTIWQGLCAGLSSVTEIRKRVELETGALRSVLEQDYCVLPEASQKAETRRVAWIAFGVLGLGALKLAMGLARSRPVSFLVIWLIVAAVIFVVALVKKSYRTTRGDAALRALRQQHDKAALQTQTFANPSPALGMLPFAIGLYGLPFLASSPFASLQQGLIPPNERHLQSSSNGCSSGCGSGCSSGGGDGGGSSGCSSGCGGCGGGGGD